jgi:hypothetical protein
MYRLKNLSLIFLLCLVLSTCKNKQVDNYLARSTPEAEGVSSEEILRFVEAADKNIKEMHSFMFLRHGKVIAEGWWDPYGPGFKHTMYSLSKSFTSTAVGFAVSEKLLSLNDKVISFFPDQLPDTLSQFLSEMTVRNLLTMTAGQSPDPTFKVVNSTDWVKTFLFTPVIDKPGSKYLYNSLATFMLSAIVQKVTGKKVIDYLTPRFFTPLGIEGIDWEVNAQGINTGGWGLRLKTEDIAKTGQFYLQKGGWHGKQILPREWIEEATSFKIEQAPKLPQAEKDSSDWMQGYGYQFSLCRNNGYRGDGAYGQFMIVMPDQDAVIVMTAEKANMQPQLNLVWKYLLPAIKTAKLPSNEESLTTLRNKLSTLALPLAEKIRSSSLEKTISGKTFVLEPNDNQIKTISLHFSENRCHVSLKIDSTDNSLDLEQGRWKMGETFLPAPNLIPNKILSGMLPFQIAGSYTWKEDNILELTLRYIETAHNQRITFRFDQNKVSIFFRNIFTQNRNIPEIIGEFVE